MKKFYLAAACLILTQPAWAGAREDARAAEQRCSAFQDDRTWLECSYGALQVMRAKLGLQPAPEYQQRLVPPAPQGYVPAPQAYAPTPASGPALTSAPSPMPATAAGPRTATATPAPTHRRGSFMQILGGTAPPVAVSALAAVRYDNQGAFIVTLENGQVWRQTDTETTTKPHFRVGEKITILPGALWSYNLKSESNTHTYKVGRTS
jgi:hypothetical protein